MRLVETLFARTALTLALAFILLLGFSAAVIGYYVLRPTAQQASEDAAARFVLVAQTWAELPPDTRADFEEELRFSHGINLAQMRTPLSPLSDQGPYLGMLKEALEDRLQADVAMGQNPDEIHVYQVDLPVGGRTLRVEFGRDRFTPEMPYALLGLVLMAALTILLTTLMLVRHLTRPLAKLSEATQRFGHGESPGELAETGPLELKALNRRFNLMMSQIRELLANRTTLLAGISHDLKTPIARLTLALEMLPEAADPGLVQRMRTDLKEMDLLITRTLQLARNMDDNGDEQVDEINLPELIDGLVSELTSDQKPILWKPMEPCLISVNTVALRRVLANLLENALRYGGDQREIRYLCNNGGVTIEVSDRGEGIPADKLETVFQPFYRLEASRNAITGGSGLGLAIVQQLCHGNGWRIGLKQRMGGGLVAKVAILAVS